METFKSYAIAHGYYNSLKRYMYDDEHLSEWGELVVVKNADAKLIEAYIKRHSLKPYSHLELFNFSQTLGLQLIETGCLLADEAFEYLVEQKKFNLVEAYIRQRPLHQAGRYPKQEIMLLKFAPEYLIQQYISKYCFYDEAQVELMGLQRKDISNAGDTLINDFLEKHIPCMMACEKLIERGNKNLIRKAFSRTAFHTYDEYAAAEIKLIEFGDTDLFKEYISKYDLFDESVQKLLAHGRGLMLVHYLTNHAVQKYENRVALTQKKDATLMRLEFQKVPFHHDGYYPDAEINMIKLGDKQLIYEYIEKWSLYEEAAEELIKLRDFNLTKAYISKYALYGTAFLEFVIEGNPDLIEVYYQKYISARCSGKPTAAFLINHTSSVMGSGILFERNIKKLIASGKTELIDAYISIPCNIWLGQSEIMFLELGNDNLALNYIQRHGLQTEQAMLWMFEHQKGSYIKAHMKKPLSDKALIKLVELQDDDLIREYISHYPLRDYGHTPEAEVLFMKYKNQVLVRSYIAKHGLYDESIVELFKMKDKALLKVLLDKHELGHVGTIQLLSSNMPDLMIFYAQKHKINPYFHDLAVRTRNLTLIRLLMKDSALSFSGFNELAVQGLFGLMSEHVKKHGFPAKDYYSRNPYFRPEKAEIDFVAYGDKEMIKKFVSSYRLSAKGEDKLAALGDMNLIQYYLSCKKKIDAQGDEF